MSSSEAQKSPVHGATEDATSEPTHDARGLQSQGGGGAAGQSVPGGDDELARRAAELKSRPDTAMGVPSNFERGAATADVRPDTDANPPDQSVIGGGLGAGDGSSGGGAGAGVPGGGTDLRTGGAFAGGDVEKDRQKLFPDAPVPRPGAGRAADDTAIPRDPDPSSYGGPLNLDDPDAV